MKMFLLFIPWVFFQSCQPASGPEVADCNFPSWTSDTAQFADFKHHMNIRGAPEPFIPESDSIYCFRGHDGWGQFDYLCSIFRDSAGYKASCSYMRNPNANNDITYIQRINPIGVLAWQEIQQAFDQRFWCDTFTRAFVCTDVTEYYLWARTGNKLLLIHWDECDDKLDTFKILAKNIQDLCGMPPPVGIAHYEIRRDSVYATIFSTNPNLEFIQSTEVYFSGKPLPVKHGSAKLVLPKKDMQALKKVLIVEHGIDGSVQKFTVSELIKGN